MPDREMLRNRLLQSFPNDSFAGLAPHLEPIRLPAGFKVANPKEKSKWIYFPETGIASIIDEYNGQRQEICLFGRDGAGCLSMLLGRESPSYLIMIQCSGDGHRISAATLNSAFQDDRGIRTVLLSFIRSAIVQIARSALANTQLNVEQRFARWLLMVHDRSDYDFIVATHELVGSTLGVSRTSVTLASLALVQSKLISTSRGKIHITDRAGLEALAGSLYGSAEAEYRKTFPDFGQHA